MTIHLYREFEDGELLGGLGYDIVVHRRLMGALTLTSGALVACDLLEHPDTEPFDVQVPPGTYPVRALLAELRDGLHLAAVAVELSEQPVRRWEVAVVAEERADMLSREPVGFAVRSQVAGLMDAQVAELLMRYQELVPEGEDALEAMRKAQFKKRRRQLGAPQARVGWAELRHELLGEGSIICFDAGLKPSLYATQLGRDASGAPARLVIDLQVLSLRFASLGPVISSEEPQFEGWEH